MTTFILVTLAELEPEWIPVTRDTIARTRYEVRGAKCKGGFTVEVKSPTSDAWQPRGWHLGAVCFATEAERDEVLRQIQSAAP